MPYVLTRGEVNDPNIPWEIWVTDEEIAQGTVRTVFLAARRHCPSHEATHCVACDGSGYVFEEFAAEIRLEPSMKAGQILRLRGLGNAFETKGQKQSGDVLVTLCQRPKAWFKPNSPWPFALSGRTTR